MTTDDPRDNPKEYAENWKNSPYRKYVKFPTGINEEAVAKQSDFDWSSISCESPSITYSNQTINTHPFISSFTMEPIDEKTAVIFGATGQDGYYLTELLLQKGYKVVAVRRRSATNNAARLGEFESDDNFSLVTGDVTDYSSILNILQDYRPIEIYNLAAQSHVGISFDQPQLTWEVTGKGCMNILEAIHFLHGEVYSPKFYQASTSEMFGDNSTGGKSKDLQGFYTYDDKSARFQDEKTPFNPQSPYAVAKLAAHHQTRLYRECYGMHASSGILFNHESPLRGENFVTRKITKYCARLKKHLDDYPVPMQDIPEFPKLMLGNLDSRRDWGHARDYVEAMWLMLQQKDADDYVIATGRTQSIRELLDVAFSYIGIDDWIPYVGQDPKFMRPAEVEYLLGRPDKAKKVLGWTPKVTFQQLIEEMIDHDYSKE